MTPKKPKPVENPRVVVISGAGLSADSGVPTFYGSGGVYGEFENPEEVVSEGTLWSNPALLHRFCDDLRVSLADKVPNPAHEALATLQREYGRDFVHITQNIDDLAERAGVEDSVHVHGFLTNMRSTIKTRLTVDIGYRRFWDGDEALAPEGGFQFRCPKTNGRMRPDVVLFGEDAPLYAVLWDTLLSLEEKDVVVVVGTQGAVLPLKHLLDKVRCRKVLMNLHWSHHLPDRDFDVVLRGRASDTAAAMLDAVRSHLGSPTSDFRKESVAEVNAG